MAENWTAGVVDLTNDTSTVATSSVIVRGYHVNTTLSAHITNINDGASTIFKIPAGAVAGTSVEFASEAGVIFNTNLIIDPDNATSAGNITILYKERVR